jgi:hypothetical protein
MASLSPSASAEPSKYPKPPVPLAPPAPFVTPVPVAPVVTPMPVVTPVPVAPKSPSASSVPSKYPRPPSPPTYTKKEILKNRSSANGTRSLTNESKMLNVSSKNTIVKNATAPTDLTKNTTQKDVSKESVVNSPFKITSAYSKITNVLYVLVFFLLMYFSVKIYTICHQMIKKRRQNLEEKKFVLPGTPSASSPNRALQKSSSGFFKVDSPKPASEPLLRHRFSTTTDNDHVKWNV